MSLSLIEAVEGEPRERLADGRADLALVRVAPDRADFVVPLGFGLSSLNASAADADSRRLRPLHLDTPRGRTGGRRGPVILVQPEDTLPLVLRRAFGGRTRVEGQSEVQQSRAVPAGLFG